MTEHAQTDRCDAHYEWLEDVEGEKALEWVEAISAETLAEFEASPRFAEYQDAALEILEADDRIAFGVIRGDQVYNFWQDADHVRGLWRRVDRAGYEADEPAWEIVLDLDALADAEDANHVWKGAAVSADYTRAMVMLSDGGKDAVTVRGVRPGDLRVRRRWLRPLRGQDLRHLRRQRHPPRRHRLRPRLADRVGLPGGHQAVAPR